MKRAAEGAGTQAAEAADAKPRRTKRAAEGAGTQAAEAADAKPRRTKRAGTKPARAKRPRKVRAPLPTIGWREWVELPDLGVELIKAKIDTGARTSALHAFDIEIFPSEGIETVYFQVHPLQDGRGLSIPTSAPLAGWRKVRSSSGHETERPLIRTMLRWHDLSWPIELTLTNRDEMGFRMLLGRQAVRRHVLVDPGRSFVDRERRDQGRVLAAQHRRRARLPRGTAAS